MVWEEPIEEEDPEIVYDDSSVCKYTCLDENCAGAGDVSPSLWGAAGQTLQGFQVQILGKNLNP